MLRYCGLPSATFLHLVIASAAKQSMVGSRRWIASLRSQ